MKKLYPLVDSEETSEKDFLNEVRAIYNQDTTLKPSWYLFKFKSLAFIYKYPGKGSLATVLSKECEAKTLDRSKASD